MERTKSEGPLGETAKPIEAWVVDEFVSAWMIIGARK
jgi:hypothetical protein